MQTYYPSLEAIHQQTMQLGGEQCKHCRHANHLISHGFIRKKQAGGREPQVVGKRVFCSNRRSHTGCGQTMQLYLDSTLRYIHYAGSTVVAFALLLLTAVSITMAYRQATQAQTPRNAYRWLDRLHTNMSFYRSLVHQPPLEPPTDPGGRPHCARRRLLSSTFSALLTRFGQPLCQACQSQLQRSFF